MAHGEWSRWCRDTIDISPQYANKYIKIYKEFNESNRIPSFDLGVKALYEIATLSEEERTKSHTIPSTCVPNLILKKKLVSNLNLDQKFKMKCVFYCIKKENMSSPLCNPL